MKTVLIVDDTEDYAENLRYVLSRAGYAVVVAVDGNDGVKKAMQCAPDLILMDVMMPGLDGVEATIKIREQGSLKDVPIVFLTALTAGEHVTVAVQGHDYPAISKMADCEKMPLKVRQHIGG